MKEWLENELKWKIRQGHFQLFQNKTKAFVIKQYAIGTEIAQNTNGTAYNPDLEAISHANVVSNTGSIWKLVRKKMDSFLDGFQDDWESIWK